MTIAFFVPSTPRPGGSKRYVGHGRIIEDCKKNKDWRACVALSAFEHFPSPLLGALSVAITFYMPRPKGHFRKDGSLKPKAPMYHTTKPDTTKLVRSTEDALTGIAWHDDAQVVEQRASKRYATATVGAMVEIGAVE